MDPAPRFETTAVVDPIPHGVWEIRSDVLEMAVIGKVLAVDAPRELHLAWRWDGEEHTTEVDITLAPLTDDVTRVSVHHTGFETPDERESHVEDWSNCLDRLVQRHQSPAIGSTGPAAESLGDRVAREAAYRDRVARRRPLA